MPLEFYETSLVGVARMGAARFMFVSAMFLGPIAQQRPYTFVVMSLLIAILGLGSIATTPVTSAAILWVGN
jgi:hypothetical protein